MKTSNYESRKTHGSGENFEPDKLDFDREKALKEIGMGVGLGLVVLGATTENILSSTSQESTTVSLIPSLLIGGGVAVLGVSAITNRKVN